MIFVRPIVLSYPKNLVSRLEEQQHRTSNEFLGILCNEGDTLKTSRARSGEASLEAAIYWGGGRFKEQHRVVTNGTYTLLHTVRHHTKKFLRSRSLSKIHRIRNQPPLPTTSSARDTTRSVALREPPFSRA